LAWFTFYFLFFGAKAAA